MHRTSAVLAASLAVLSAGAGAAIANTSHAGWPAITGALIVNKTDADRPIDMRVGQDPFDHQDPTYRCDSVHNSHSCFKLAHPKCAAVVDGRCTSVEVINPPDSLHNELLGGHGNDTIHAGPNGDVLWADYKPSGQPSSQHDSVAGGAGRDFIYASHGTNTIDGGGGRDHIKAHYGRGSINCGAGHDILYISAKAQRKYHISGCETISHKSLGY